MLGTRIGGDAGGSCIFGLEHLGPQASSRIWCGFGPSRAATRDVRKREGLTMRVIAGVLALIGLMVLLVFLAAIGLFAYDEIRLRLQERNGDGAEPAATE